MQTTKRKGRMKNKSEIQKEGKGRDKGEAVDVTVCTKMGTEGQRIEGIQNAEE